LWSWGGKEVEPDGKTVALNSPETVESVGFATPQVLTKYVIADMYAKAIQGMQIEAAVKWAHDELVKVYD
jgi:hypothetical protein